MAYNGPPPAYGQQADAKPAEAIPVAEAVTDGPPLYGQQPVPPMGGYYPQGGMPPPQQFGPQYGNPMGYQPPNNTAGRTCMQCVVLGCSVCACITAFVLMAVGVPLLVIGTNDINAINNLSPETDFQSVSSCPILSVEHNVEERRTTETRRESNRDVRYERYKCMDVYNYKFEVEGSGYLSRDDDKTRFEKYCRNSCGSQSCPNDGDKASSTWNVGESPQCWKTTVGGPYSKYYKCGNDNCYKLFDPVEEVASAEEAAKGLQIGGMVCLILGCIGIIPAAIGVWCACKIGRS